MVKIKKAGSIIKVPKDAKYFQIRKVKKKKNEVAITFSSTKNYYGFKPKYMTSRRSHRRR